MSKCPHLFWIPGSATECLQFCLQLTKYQSYNEHLKHIIITFIMNDYQCNNAQCIMEVNTRDWLYHSHSHNLVMQPRLILIPNKQNHLKYIQSIFWLHSTQYGKCNITMSKHLYQHAKNSIPRFRLWKNARNLLEYPYRNMKGKSELTIKWVIKYITTVRMSSSLP